MDIEMPETLIRSVEHVSPALSTATVATRWESETRGSRSMVCVWVSVLVAIIVAEGSLVAFFHLKPQCEVQLGSKVTTSVDVDALVAPRLLSPVFSGALVTAFVVYRRRYVAGWTLHFWTLCFAVVTFGWSWIGLLATLNRCASKPLLFNRGLLLLRDVFLCLAINSVVHLSLVKLRALAMVAPVVARVGEMSGQLLVAVYVFYLIPELAFPARDGLYFRVIMYVAALGAGASIVFFGSLVVVLFLATNIALAETSQQDVDDNSARRLTISAKWTTWTMIATAAAGITNATVHGVMMVLVKEKSGTLHMLACWAFALDMLTNIIASGLLSGILIGGADSLHVSTSLTVVAGCIPVYNRRHIEQQLTSIAGASTGSALTIAYFMDGVPPATILREAESRFRCITWEALAARSDVIIGGRPLNVIGPGGNDLYSLSEHCHLGDCDMFVSHSWHDDGPKKWEALRSWCDTFVRTQGYHPRLWIDKFCICQTSIETDLRCLPVFLAGCKGLLMISGPTYPTRLWCLIEVLVHRAIMASDESRFPPELLLLGDDAERKGQQQAWRAFDVRRCNCFIDEDKRRFFDLVNRYPRGSAGFNLFVRETIPNLLTLSEARLVNDLE